MPEQVTLPAERTALIAVRGTSDKLSAERNVALPYRVENLLVAPAKALQVELKLEVTFVGKI